MAGKGGAGKTTLSATLARLAARCGNGVVAIDADTNPNLATALGIDPAAAGAVPFLPVSIVSRRFDGPALNVALDDVLRDHTTAGPDGVRLVRMGMPDHAQEGCLCSAHAAGAALLADLGGRPRTWTVMDLEASPEHLSRGTARHADILVLVAEPYFRSLETVRLQARLAAELPGLRVGVVANKLRSAADADAVAEFVDTLGLPLWGRVPWSDAVTAADRERTAVIDADPDGAVVAAIGAVFDALASLGVHGSTAGAPPCA